MFLTGLAGTLGWVPLPDGLKLLENPILLTASGVLLAVEFFADKIPGLDSIWDSVHTFLRVPAGAALAAGVFGGDNQTWANGGSFGWWHAGCQQPYRQIDDPRCGQCVARADVEYWLVAAG